MSWKDEAVKETNKVLLQRDKEIYDRLISNIIYRARQGRTEYVVGSFQNTMPTFCSYEFSEDIKERLKKDKFKVENKKYFFGLFNKIVVSWG